MSTAEELKQSKIEEPDFEENQEEVEEEEPIDLELQAAMKNVQLDEGIFGSNEKKGETQGDKSKSATSKKSKKKKGEDFLDYANKNGIQLNLEYEDKAHAREFKKTFNNSAENTNKEGGKPRPKHTDAPYQKNEKYANNQTGEKKYPYKGYTKKPFYPKRNFNKTGNNKFDLCNMHLPKMMHMMQPVYNPYTLHGGMMPHYMTPMMSNMPMNYPTPSQVPSLDLQDNSDKSITDFLENYLSLENLNQDLYLRNRIDECGFIEASEIANHNKLRYKGVTLDKIYSLLAENSNQVIEAVSSEDGTFHLRNRDWENIKDKLAPIEYIQQQKKMMKSANYMNPMNTLNYVSLQNNYFFSGMPHVGQENSGMGGMYMGYQYPMPNTNLPQPGQPATSEPEQRDL